MQTERCHRSALWQAASPRLTERCDQDVRETSTGTTIGIEARIVDGDFEPDCFVTCERSAKYRGQLIQTQPARHTEVHGGHDRIVQAIRIDVNKKAVELCAG